eukprot:m.15256 g.15256  ORF g.15256 m.15256 type:complete len:109 (-) comp24755_c0_seq1:112-438(-)
MADHGAVAYLNTKDEFTSTIGRDEVCIVDFTAVWCPPCQAIAPRFQEFSVKYPSVKFYKVDVDKNQGASQLAGITAMPTFIVYKAGAKLESLRGANVAGLEALINKHK